GSGRQGRDLDQAPALVHRALRAVGRQMFAPLATRAGVLPPPLAGEGWGGGKPQARRSSPGLLPSSPASGGGGVRGSCLRNPKGGYLMKKSFRLVVAIAGLAVAFPTHGQNLDKVTFGTNWVAEAEHGGFYQALADGTYRRYGLDVAILPG